jgi:hypothetical protein
MSSSLAAQTSVERDRAVDDLRRSLVATFSPSVEALDPVPQGTVEQARRFAMLSADLMRQGAFDYDSLAHGWNVSSSAARKRVLRAAHRHELFTVTYRERTFVPAVLLDEHLEPRAELASIIAALVTGGDGGFALWAWLVTPTAWLDGAVPNELATTDPDRVAHAATLRASNAA